MLRRHFKTRVQDFGKSKEKRMKHERSNCPSLMARSFRFHAWLCRLCGGFFIQNLFDRNAQSPPRIVWKSWYLLYSIMCLAFMLWMEVDIITYEESKAAQTHYYLDTYLLMITHSVLLIKIFVNISAMFLGTSATLNFYQRSASFESRVGIPSCKCCAPKKHFWSDVQRAFCCLLYSALVTVSVSLALRRDPPAGRKVTSKWTKAYFYVKLEVLLVFFFVYDSVYAAALHSSSEVLVVYMKNQLKILEQCVAGRPDLLSSRTFDDVAMAVEVVRANLCEIQQLKMAINEVWRWPLITSSICTLFVLCTVVYSACKYGLAHQKRYDGFIYSAFITYDFTKLALVSQSMINTAKEIKDFCKITYGINDIYIQHQVAHLKFLRVLKQSCYLHIGFGACALVAVGANKGSWLMDYSHYSNGIRHKLINTNLLHTISCVCFDWLTLRSPKVVWLHWYTLYAAACFTFFLWFETDVVTRHAIELSDTNRFFTKSLLVLLHVVILIKASGNFVSMIVGCKKMIEFLQKADTFEKESGVPTCTCCGREALFLGRHTRHCNICSLFYKLHRGAVPSRAKSRRGRTTGR
ncbi:hypothetical protein HPB48_022451 [Haemaphysalis longicornis]|uniref:Gustatory receptor n=1 Tax=Haemaphysalis longicornis TaxID=44386 RepID=A0A9J6G485_HAELO|nr:hypothetical protein HPB48_022451 [Haemaphysalis longicornis]